MITAIQTKMNTLQNIKSNEVKKLVKTLCDLVSSTEDVNFDSRGKGSFCELVSVFTNMTL